MGDEGVRSEDNLIDEISLPLSLSAGVLYIIQRFLNQVDENEASDEENWPQLEHDVVEVNLELDDSEEEESGDEAAPTSGEGDMQSREPQPDLQVTTTRRPRTNRYRTRWTNIRRSDTPETPFVDPISLPRLSDTEQSAARVRSRSPIARDRLQPPPSES